jgi:hypothetical protein
MIEFAEGDYNMSKIQAECKFGDIKTKKNFRIFGLSQEDNPPIGIRYNMDKSKVSEVEEELRGWFKESGLILDFEHQNDELFSIGLRKDIRENIKLASSLLKTIIFYFDGQLELEEGFKIPELAKFKSTQVDG